MVKNLKEPSTFVVCLDCRNLAKIVLLLCQKNIAQADNQIEHITNPHHNHSKMKWCSYKWNEVLIMYPTGYDCKGHKEWVK